MDWTPLPRQTYPSPTPGFCSLLSAWPVQIISIFKKNGIKQWEGGCVKYFTSIPKKKLQCDKFYTLNHKCIVMLLVLLKYSTLKNDHGGLFGLSEFEFNNTYNFRFIFDYLYISCRFLFLHSSLHTPFVKAGALFVIHRIQVF